MKRVLVVLAALALVVIAFNISRYLGLVATEEETTVEANLADETVPKKGDYLVSDTLYRWDDLLLDWVAVSNSPPAPKPTFTSIADAVQDDKPDTIDWPLLINIEYQLKFFEEMEMEIYAPVFGEDLKALNGKEVIIKGFVIPFDETGEIVALSANPFASCFFCGKASPASVASLYLKRKKAYRMDDFRAFRGVLKLNYNDPKEYYYILNDAVPVE